MAATEKLLNMLHEAVGQGLLDRIVSGEATAAEYGQAVKFLKDNGIEAIPNGNSTLDNLAESMNDRLPFTNPNEDSLSHH